jgi:hypothetical protein
MALLVILAACAWGDTFSGSTHKPAAPTSGALMTLPFVIEQGEPWFLRFREIDALLAFEDSPLRIDDAGEAVIPELKLGARPRRVLGLLAACGTPELGFTLYQCPHCHGRHGIARSCGDRHCPRCLAAKSQQWLAQQTRSLLPTTYYHCVLTLPEALNALVLANPARLYPLLFDSAAQSLLQFGRNRLQADLGISAVLHPWGQQLHFHPHLHCIVTGGALSSDGQRWRSPKQRKFLFPVKALSVLFQGKFLDGLKKMWESQSKLRLPDPSLRDPQLRQRWFSKLYAQKWVVYAKRPFGG